MEKTVVNKNGKDIYCFNQINECSAFLINTNDNDFYADCSLDLENKKNRKWHVVVDHLIKKYPNQSIEEIVAC